MAKLTNAHVSMMPMPAETGRPIAGVRDPLVAAASRELGSRLRAKLGPDFVRLVLFGSRARGDDTPDSDADVAVILRDRLPDRWAVKRSIIDECWPILPATGLYIQPWPLSEDELADPEHSFNPALVRNVLREGIAGCARTTS